jgi:dihydrodipicolinate reductase
MGKHDEVCITHRAYSRGLFAEGALDLLSWQHLRRRKLAGKLVSVADYAKDLMVGIRVEPS